MFKFIKNVYVELFLAAMSQVTFVAMNVYLVSHKYYLPAFITGFMISVIWSFNVKKIAFGTSLHRIVYALGAATGTVLGMIVMHLIYH